MAELIAQGPKPGERWRRKLPANQAVVVGRDAGEWSVPWETFLSRRQAELTWHNGVLSVKRLDGAANPMFFGGEETTRFEMSGGAHFVIGGTTFLLLDAQSETIASDDLPLQERTISVPELERIPFQDAHHQIGVLSRLPEVISGAASDSDLFVRLVNMLLAGMRHAEGVALVEATGTDNAPVHVLQVDSRLQGATEFRPSQRLVREAVRRQQTVVHVWGGAKSDAGMTFTAAGNFDWAFCTPIRGEGSKGWGIYVVGRFAGRNVNLQAPLESHELGDDLKFAELVASIVGSLRQVRLLQRQQASLSSFFSPAVMRSLAEADPETALNPREAEVTVLFCDLRGFSRQSEKQAKALTALLERVSKALRVMTQNILDQGGVIGDFQGDAALGFWGWPLPQPDMVQRACQAALGIRTVFEDSAKQPDNPLADFQVGIGLATGQAVAGKIGTVDQVKIGVFGPVVNLASRLEGMTKILRASILLDENTAHVVCGQVPKSVARCRRLAVVKPYGLDTALTVSELLPPAAEYPLLTDEHLAIYEAALTAFLQGEWLKTNELLHQLPYQDRGKDFLTSFIIRHNHTPPTGWSGVVPLESK